MVELCQKKILSCQIFILSLPGVIYFSKTEKHFGILANFRAKASTGRLLMFVKKVMEGFYEWNWLKINENGQKKASVQFFL